MKDILSERKAQVIGQVFIYIMAAIIIGIIILIGYNAISGTIERSCQVEQAGFKTKIESLIDKSSNYGSITRQPISAPCRYEEVCFIDAQSIGQPLADCGNKIISASSRDGDLKNIFVSSSKATVPIGYSPLLKIENPSGCTCITQKSKNFFITFEGEGSATLVKAAS